MKSELLERAERMTWKEYVKNLDLSHWDWRNVYPWSDREVVFISDKLLLGLPAPLFCFRVPLQLSLSALCCPLPVPAPLLL